MSEISEQLPAAGRDDDTLQPWEVPPVSYRHNYPATAALVCAALTALFGWVPVLGWVLWLAAIVLSLIGLTRTPRWQATLALVLTAVIAVVALIFAIVGSRAVHSLFSFMAVH